MQIGGNGFKNSRWKFSSIHQ